MLREPPFYDNPNPENRFWSLSWFEWLRDISVTVNDKADSSAISDFITDQEVDDLLNSLEEDLHYYFGERYITENLLPEAGTESGHHLGNLFIEGDSEVDGYIEASSHISSGGNIAGAGTLAIDGESYLGDDTLIDGDLEVEKIDTTGIPWVSENFLIDSPLVEAGTEQSEVLGNFRAERLFQYEPWHAYGGFQDKNETITIALVNQWTWITDATHTLWTGLEAEGFTLSGDIMTVTNAADYSGIVTSTISGLNGKDFQIRCYNITQAKQMGYYIGGTTTGAGNFTPIALPLYLECNKGDQLRMEIRCITDDSDPTFKNSIFWLSYLHHNTKLN